MSLLCIFAHPDDESFGPGGTIATLSKKSEVYVLCATKGEAGNGGGGKKLGDKRTQELRDSAKILGVKEVIFLGFLDGDLSNNKYHKIADKIQKCVDEIKPEILLTFEPMGVSGHIDHMAISMITTYVFNKSKSPKQLWYFCFSKEQRAYIKDYFIYFPPGYHKKDIDKSMDVTDVWEKRIEAVKCHKSQKGDVKFMLEFLNNFPKKEYFLVVKK